MLFWETSKKQDKTNGENGWRGENEFAKDTIADCPNLPSHIYAFCWARTRVNLYYEGGL